jgi:HAD superfamily hydrolase (TIGR01509 family)
MSDIKAILWDNDGVLVDTEQFYFCATRQVLAEIKVDLTKDLYRELLLKQGKGAWHLAAERGVSPTEVDRLRERRNELYDQFLQQEPLVVEGAAETLHALHGRFVMGIVTSSRKDHFDTIHRSSGLLEYVDFVIASGDYTQHKPHPEPYLLAVERTGFRRDECIAVEDSERGLAAAVAAGIRCLVVPTEMTRGSDFANAYKVIGSVTDVARVLDMHEPGCCTSP